MLDFLSIFVGLAIDYRYWFILWFFLLVLSVVWSGLYKFLVIVFFPGRLLHSATHFLAARILKLKFILYLSLRSFEDKSSKTIYVSGGEISIRKLSTFVFFPALTAVLFGIVARQILLIALLNGKFDLALPLAWLALSFGVIGMPDRGDLELLFSSFIMKYPEFIFILLWTPIVYLVGLFSVGDLLAIIGSFLFLFLASLIIAFVPRREIVVIE